LTGLRIATLNSGPPPAAADKGISSAQRNKAPVTNLGKADASIVLPRYRDRSTHILQTTAMKSAAASEGLRPHRTA
jgi:hypothetical protein